MLLTLDALLPGEIADVLGVEAGEALRHRLTALGLRVGEPARVLRRAPLRGPLHVRLGTTEIILREAEARCVRIARRRKAP